MKSKMYNLTIGIIVVILISSGISQTTLTVEDIFGTSKYAPKILSGVQWAPDGNSFTYFETDPETETRYIKGVDVKTGERSILIDSRNVDVLDEPGSENRFTIPNYHWSPSGTHILLRYENDLYLYDTMTCQAQRLTMDEAHERDPTFSPDGKKIAFLKAYNLHVLNIASGQVTQLTFQGTENRLIGRFDWVYEEEFSIRTGFFWSPDSRYLAYFQLDQSHENEFPIVDFIPIHNEAPVMRYPKAGDRNAIVKIGVVPAGGGRSTWMDIGTDDDIYIPRIQWLTDSRQLAIQRLNREQNQLDLMIADITTGQSHVIITEEDPHGWIDVHDDLTFLNDGRHFIWTSDRSDWTHLYLYDVQGRCIRQLTDGAWDVTRLIHVDEKKKTIYFMGTEKSNIERHLYKVGFNGKRMKRLTLSEGTHGIIMSPDGRYYIDIFSNITSPPKTTLYHRNGELAYVIESGDIKSLQNVPLAIPEFMTLTTIDGLELNAMITKPLDFDPSKKYPVLIYTYGGPGSQIVRNSWGGSEGLWHQMMLSKGFILFSVDNRGTGFKGNTFKNMVYKNMGVGVTDQINGAKYLKTLPYIDKNRIGIWGWSGGGWMTSMAMTKGADHFNAGVGVAPVTDFRNYDTIWTERYMGQPQENTEGYDASNPMSHIDNYKGGLFLIHGSADDNVHVSNIMQLAYALQNARKPFHMMVYPRKLHGIRGMDTQVHLFNLITDYFVQNL